MAWETSPHVEDAPFLSSERLVELLDGAAGAYLLESGGDHALSRYTLAGAAPVDQIRVENARSEGAGALARLDALCGRGRGELVSPSRAPWPLCRHVGYLGYELGAVCERFPDSPPSAVPDALFATYDAGYVADRHTSTARVWGVTRTAALALREVLGRAAPTTPAPAPLTLGPVDGDDARSRDTYLEGVRRIQRYIAAGDIYQANLARRFQTAFANRPADLYRSLRASSPAPFAALVDLDEVCLASTSPERFLAFDLGARSVETRPIKGTRARASTALADREAMSLLRASEKDRAEHVMIVDLERSDLGRLCERGSVEVVHLAQLETFAHLHHLVSVVRGRLRDGVGFADLLRATFPGGSITGAPKVRAMEIIAELEGVARGPCFGAFGWLDGRGRGDLALAIRTAYVAKGTLTFAAGGGIVADSAPLDELAEASLKARAFTLALARP